MLSFPSQEFVFRQLMHYTSFSGIIQPQNVTRPVLSGIFRIFHKKPLSKRDRSTRFRKIRQVRMLKKETGHPGAGLPDNRNGRFSVKLY